MSSPTPAPEIQPAKSQEAPHQPQQIIAGASLQLSQNAPYVPYHVWTPEILMDYHKKLYETGIDNNRVIENMRKREDRQGWAAIIIVAGIIGFACYLTVLSNPLGEKILGVTVAFLAGYLAGRGRANVK
jgi:hypothetical protein